MDPYPHSYVANASGALSGAVSVTSPEVAGLATAPAPQFGGPAGFWSPETLLTAAIANCYLLTFRAVSGAALFGWLALECRVEGLVTRVARVPQFAALGIQATLTIAPGADSSKARRLLRQADRACLIANSLKAQRTLGARVVVDSAQAPRPIQPSGPALSSS